MTILPWACAAVVLTALGLIVVHVILSGPINVVRGITLPLPDDEGWHRVVASRARNPQGEQSWLVNGKVEMWIDAVKEKRYSVWIDDQALRPYELNLVDYHKLQRYKQAVYRSWLSRVALTGEDPLEHAVARLSVVKDKKES